MSDFKLSEFSGRRPSAAVGVDDVAAHSLGYASEKPIEFGRLTLGLQPDPPVGQVPHIARYAIPPGDLDGGVSKSNALHPALVKNLPPLLGGGGGSIGLGFCHAW